MDDSKENDVDSMVLPTLTPMPPRADRNKTSFHRTRVVSHESVPAPRPAFTEQSWESFKEEVNKTLELFHIRLETLEREKNNDRARNTAEHGSFSEEIRFIRTELKRIEKMLQGRTQEDTTRRIRDASHRAKKYALPDPFTQPDETTDRASAVQPEADLRLPPAPIVPPNILRQDVDLLKQDSQQRHCFSGYNDWDLWTSVTWYHETHTFVFVDNKEDHYYIKLLSLGRGMYSYVIINPQATKDQQHIAFTFMSQDVYTALQNFSDSDADAPITAPWNPTQLLPDTHIKNLWDSELTAATHVLPPEWQRECEMLYYLPKPLVTYDDKQKKLFISSKNKLGEPDSWEVKISIGYRRNMYELKFYLVDTNNTKYQVAKPLPNGMLQPVEFTVSDLATALYLYVKIVYAIIPSYTDTFKQTKAYDILAAFIQRE